MKILYRPLCGGLGKAMGRVKEFESVKEMFEYLVEQHDHAFEMNNLYISYYCYDSRIDWDTYIITTSKYADEDYLKKGYPPQAAGFCTFRSEE